MLSLTSHLTSDRNQWWLCCWMFCAGRTLVKEIMMNCVDREFPPLFLQCERRASELKFLELFFSVLSFALEYESNKYLFSSILHFLNDWWPSLLESFWWLVIGETDFFNIRVTVHSWRCLPVFPKHLYNSVPRQSRAVLMQSMSAECGTPWWRLTIQAASAGLLSQPTFQMLTFSVISQLSRRELEPAGWAHWLFRCKHCHALAVIHW